MGVQLGGNVRKKHNNFTTFLYEDNDEKYMSIYVNTIFSVPDGRSFIQRLHSDGLKHVEAVHVWDRLTTG